MTVELWHFTCRHSARNIGRRGILVPNPQPQLLASGRPSLVWLTGSPEPDVEALGLTRTMIPCDRTERRYRVEDASTVQSWATYKLRLDRADVSALEFGRQWRTWYVSTQPVPVRFEP